MLAPAKPRFARWRKRSVSVRGWCGGLWWCGWISPSGLLRKVGTPSALPYAGHWTCSFL